MKLYIISQPSYNGLHTDIDWYPVAACTDQALADKLIERLAHEVGLPIDDFSIDVVPLYNDITLTENDAETAE